MAGADDPKTSKSRTATVDRAGPQNYVDYDEFVDFQLEKTRSNLRSNEVFTTLTIIASVFAGYLLLFVFFDQWVVAGGFSLLTRGLMLSLLLGAIASISFRHVMIPLMRRIHPLYAARALEQADAKFQGNLINFVDLRSGGRPSSTSVVRAIEKRAAVGLDRMDVEEAVDRRPLLRAAYALLGVVVLSAAYIILSPKDPFASVQRALFPMKAISVATETTISDVTPGDDRVPARSVVTIEADIRGKPVDQVQVLFTTADRKYVDHPAEMRRIDAGLPRFRGVLNGENGRGLLQNLEYRVVAGDAETQTFHIVVSQPPSAEVEQISYSFPNYMQLDDREQQGGAIDGWEGTKVTLRAKTNMPVSQARLVLTDADVASSKGEDIPLKVTDGNQLEATWTLQFRSDGTYARFYHIEIKTPSGDADPDPTHLPIVIRPDQRPDVALLHPSTDLKKPENAVVPLLITASDPDFLLRSVTLKCEKNGELIRDHSLFEPDLPGRSLKGTYELKLADLTLNPGDRLQYWIEARDNKMPTSNRTNTPRMSIEIEKASSEEDVQRDLAKEQQKLDQQLAQAEHNPNQSQPDDANRTDDPQETPDRDSEPRDAERDSAADTPNNAGTPPVARSDDNPGETGDSPQNDLNDRSRSEEPQSDQEEFERQLERILQKERQQEQDDGSQRQSQPQDDNENQSPGTQSAPQSDIQRGNPGDRRTERDPRNKTGAGAGRRGRDKQDDNAEKPDNNSGNEESETAQVESSQDSPSKRKNPRTDGEQKQSNNKTGAQQQRSKSQPPSQDEGERPDDDNVTDNSDDSGAANEQSTGTSENRTAAEDRGSNNRETRQKSSPPGSRESTEDNDSAPNESGADTESTETVPGEKRVSQPTKSVSKPDSKGKSTDGSQQVPKPDSDSAATDDDARQPNESDDDAPESRKNKGKDPEEKGPAKGASRPQEAGTKGGGNRSEDHEEIPQGDRPDRPGEKSAQRKPKPDKSGKSDAADADDPRGEPDLKGQDSGEQSRPGQQRELNSQKGPDGQRTKPGDRSDPRVDQVDRNTEESAAESEQGQTDSSENVSEESDREEGGRRPSSGGEPKGRQSASNDQSTQNSDEPSDPQGKPGESGSSRDEEKAQPDQTGVKQPGGKPSSKGGQETPRSGNQADKSGEKGGKPQPRGKEAGDDVEHDDPASESAGENASKKNDPQRRPSNASEVGNQTPKGGGRKNGQKSDQPQTGENGQSGASDQGESGGNQEGAGEGSNQQGESGTADGKTGESSETQSGNGSKSAANGRRQTKSGGDSSASSKSGAAGDNSTDESRGAESSDDATEKGQTGGSKSGRPSTDAVGSDEGDPGRDASQESGQSGQQGSRGSKQSPGGAPRGEARGTTGGGRTGNSPSGGTDSPDKNHPGSEPETNQDPDRATPSESEPNDEQSKLEHLREASNLVLQKLKGKLDRGEVDEEFMNEMGFQDLGQLQKFLTKLEEQIDSSATDNSPEAVARRKQFEEMLKSMRLGGETQRREQGQTGSRRVNQVDAGRRPVPTELRERYEAYTRSLNRQKSSDKSSPTRTKKPNSSAASPGTKP